MVNTNSNKECKKKMKKCRIKSVELAYLFLSLLDFFTFPFSFVLNQIGHTLFDVGCCSIQLIPASHRYSFVYGLLFFLFVATVARCSNLSRLHKPNSSLDYSNLLLSFFFFVSIWLRVYS